MGFHFDSEDYEDGYSTPIKRELEKVVVFSTPNQSVRKTNEKEVVLETQLHQRIDELQKKVIKAQEESKELLKIVISILSKYNLDKKDLKVLNKYSKKYDKS